MKFSEKIKIKEPYSSQREVVVIQKYIRVNERIRCPEVRVIGPNSEQLGVVVIKRALELAQESELDLVEVAPTATPPVCRIMDFSKYKYDQEKKERRVKRSQHVAQLKQIRIKPHIDENDFQIKLRQAVSFLEKKDKVKINLFFRGREVAYKDLGQKVLDRFIEEIAPHGQVEKPSVMEGRVMSVMIAPLADKQ
ncbi:MAG: translation initiation factor IF-3 [Candidatus Omnitrophica bacterium]|nr:translation initiation factor IF-3 [Candidatus Omnitrophota bacterium]